MWKVLLLVFSAMWVPYFCDDETKEERLIGKLKQFLEREEQNSGKYNKGPWPNGKVIASSLLDGLLMEDEEILYFRKEEIDDFMNTLNGKHVVAINTRIEDIITKLSDVLAAMRNNSASVVNLNTLIEYVNDTIHVDILSTEWEFDAIINSIQWHISQGLVAGVTNGSSIETGCRLVGQDSSGSTVDLNCIVSMINVTYFALERSRIIFQVLLSFAHVERCADVLQFIKTEVDWNDLNNKLILMIECAAHNLDTIQAHLAVNKDSILTKPLSFLVAAHSKIKEIQRQAEANFRTLQHILMKAIEIKKENEDRGFDVKRLVQLFWN